MDDTDERAIVLGDRVFPLTTVRTLFADLEWVWPIITLYVRSEKYGSPWGAETGWLAWPAWYVEIREALDAARAALEKES